MKNLNKNLISCAIILLTIIFLFCFKKTPSSDLWKNYSVFYIEKNADYSFVVDVLNKFDIKEFISKQNQDFPLNISKNTPEYALAFSGLENSDYLTEKNKYFTDKFQNYQIFYVPKEFKNNLENVVEFINDFTDFECGFDASSSFPFLIVAVLLIFTILLIYKSEYKILFLLCSILPVFYCFMLPFYSAICGICMFLLEIFISLKMWNRTGGIKRLLKVKFLQIIFILSLINSFCAGFLSGILFIFVILSIFSILNLYNEVCKKQTDKNNFKPQKILSAKMITLISKNTVFSIFLCLISIFSILIFSVFSTSFGSVNSKNLMLPSSNANSSFVDLTDFVDWRWEVLTFPYISLNSSDYNKNVDKKNKVIFSEYKDNPDSIEETVNVLTFDDKFIENSLNSIDNLSFPALEKMLKSEGLKNSAGYASNVSQKNSIFTIIVMLSSFLICLAFFVVCYKKIKK